MVTPNALSTQARFRSRLCVVGYPHRPQTVRRGRLEPEKPRTPRIGASFLALRTRLIAEFRDERHTRQRYEGSGMDDLDVQVQGTSISVTGTDFAVTYEKHPDLRILVVTQSRVDRSTLPDVTHFHGRAFQAAVAKARELGWIA